MDVSCACQQRLGLPKAGSHTSKSVALPVGLFRANIWGDEEVFFFTRDNFHDLKLVVVASCPIHHLPYEEAHVLWSSERYEEEKKRSYEYQRPKPEKNLSGSHNFDEAHYETDAWYSKWSSGSILRDEGEIYRAGSTASCYYEGIERILPAEVFVRYERGLQSFAVEVPGSTVPRLMSIMQSVVQSAQKYVMDERRRKEELEELQRYRRRIAFGEELNERQQKRVTELSKRYGKGESP